MYMYTRILVDLFIYTYRKTSLKVDREAWGGDFRFHFDLILRRCHFDSSSISLWFHFSFFISHRFHFVFTSISLRSHFEFTSIPLRFHFGITSNSFRPHIDLTSVPHRFHADPTSVSLRFHFDLTSISLRFRIDVTSISVRSHF